MKREPDHALNPLAMLAIGLMTLLALSVVPGLAIAERDDDDDLVEVHVLGRRIIAVRGEGSTVIKDLYLDEEIRWRGQRGDVGAIVTDRRVLAITSTSSSWQESALRIAEAGATVPIVSRNLAAVDTGQRIIIFDALIGTFIEWQYPLKERVVALDAEDDVVAAVLRHQVMGYGAGRAEPVSARLHLKEKFESLSLQSKSASVTTSKRLLSFRRESSGWTEVDRSFTW